MDRLTTMAYGVLPSVTSFWRTQMVEPLGRWANRTSSHPGAVEMTGKMDGYPNQLPGTVMFDGAPGAG